MAALATPGDAEGEVYSDRYERLELIGTGSFGDVYRGWDREAGVEVAIKVIDLENVEDDINDIHKEVAILAQCRSQNITEYYASVLEPGTTELFIVMELMACSVGDLLSSDGSHLDERSIALVLRETLKALVYLHGNQRIHRDVKSANILLSAHGEVKISDFGVSGQLSKTAAFKRRTFVGSPFWMAPEVIKANTGGDGYSETADIWSLGITAFEMANGAPPHADLHPMRALFLIPADDAPRLEGPFSPELKSFISQCLQKESSLRPSAEALLKHPFLAGSHDSGRLAELVQVHSGRKRKALATIGQPLQFPDAASGMARWDFDTQRQPPPEPAQRPAGQKSIRSHEIINFTVRDTWGGTMPSRQRQGTVAHRGSDGPLFEDAVEDLHDASMEPDLHVGLEGRGAQSATTPSLIPSRAPAETARPLGQDANQAATGSIHESARVPLHTTRADEAGMASQNVQVATDLQAPQQREVGGGEPVQPVLRGSVGAATDGHAAAFREQMEGSRLTLPAHAVLGGISVLQMSALSPMLIPDARTTDGQGSVKVNAPNPGSLGTFLLTRWQHRVARGEQAA